MCVKGRMDDVTKTMRRIYDLNAVDYARRTVSLESFPGLEVELDRLARRLGPGARVLDLGCGGGRDTLYLSGRKLRVVAVDVSAVLLRITRDRCPDAAVVEADMVRLPFRGETFGGAWVCGSLVHVPLRLHRQVLNELCRVLQPGAALAISMKEGDGEGWSQGELMAQQRWFSYVRPENMVSTLHASGFHDGQVRLSGRGTWYVAEARKSAGH